MNLSKLVVPLKPFMPYQGGKRKLLPTLRANTPDDYKNYYEPFIGGGAFGLDLMHSDWVNGKTGHKYHLSDYSQNVVDAWTSVQQNPEGLETLLMEHYAKHSEERFMAIRNIDRLGLLRELSQVERGARFIYLAQTCFGSLITSDKHGFSTMSYNSDIDRIRAVKNRTCEQVFKISVVLNDLDVSIQQASYEQAVMNAGFKDFVYLDPPYETTADTDKDAPKRKISSNYVNSPLNHAEVHRHVFEMTSRGAYSLLSNSNTEVTRNLFKRWAMSNPKIMYGIGRAGKKVKESQELLVANWRLSDHLYRAA